MYKKFCVLLKKYTNSIWVFPAILTFLLLVLSLLQISGSSIGVYHYLFYGNDKDPALIGNTPKPIRADEWRVNTQKALAQKNSYDSINKNIGNGENTSLIADIPNNDWSTLFKPHNIGFLVLPFENAFSLKWWLMAYLLMLSVYFFTITMLPKKRLIASLISLSVFFSPFIQWWYAYGTLGPIYYSLFGATIYIKLLHSSSRKDAIIWSLLLAYTAVSFMLVLYPPFQIPCALVLVTFAFGYYLDNRDAVPRSLLKNNLSYFFIAIALALSVVGVFFYQNRDTVAAIQNSAYPGQRKVINGNYSKEHILSGNLGILFQDKKRADSYSRPSLGITNESESSNFILIFPFLLLPLLYILCSNRKKKIKFRNTFLSITFVATIFTLWMFVPNLEILGKVTLLGYVPLQRLLIGFGLLNIVFLVIFMKIYDMNKFKFSIYKNAAYAFTIFIFYIGINFHILNQFPNFIGYKYAIALALPISIIIFLFLQKKYLFAILIYLVFSFLSSYQVNPIYKGVDILSNTPISQEIRTVGSVNSSKKWVSEDSILENFVAMNGYPSLTGTYLYPQVKLWKDLRQPEILYNRYAHINFIFDRNSNKFVNPYMSSPSPDQVNIMIEPCDNFLKNNNVGYIITSTTFERNLNDCISLYKKVVYPKVTFLIYRLNFKT
jgi:hypothetical protein